MSSASPSADGQTPYDIDAQETREWLDALTAVIEAEGPDRAHFLLEQLLEEARQHSVDMPFSANTGYVNTIEPEQEEHSPGNLELEGRLRAYMRWNAMALVVKANRLDPADGGDLGGHISSFASLAASTTSGMPTVMGMVAICSTSRATALRASMPAPSWKDGSPRSRC